MHDPKSAPHGVSGVLVAHGLTDRGSVRQNNEDYFGFYIPEDPGTRTKRGSLFAVSDGVGGSAAGEAASAEAVNVLLQEYYFGKHSEKAPDRLKNAFQCTTFHVYTLSVSNTAARNMKCTLTTLLVHQDRFFIAHVGDSKVLLLRDDRIIQLTNDHNLVGKLLRLGLISEEDARNHPDKNVLLKAVGEGPLLVPDFRYGALKPGALFCLVTDGILEHAGMEELQSFLLEREPSPQRLSELAAELNRRGGYDNMTILMVKVNGVPC